MWKPQKAPGLGHSEAYERGHVAHLLDQRLELYAALSGLAGYNPALAALALSQQPRRPWLPMAGIIVTLLITPGFIALGLAPLTAPFILGCWLVHASVRILRPAQEQCRLRIER